MIYVNAHVDRGLPSFSTPAISPTEMDESFTTKPLGRSQIDQAYPLVRMAAPGLAVEQWRAFAAAVLKSGAAGGRTGIMTVQDRLGYLHGLFSYTVGEHLRHGRVLSVDNFVVLDLFDVPGIAQPLLQAMDGLARSLDCAAIHTTLLLPPPAPGQPGFDATARHPMIDCLYHDGHRRETIRLCKPLDGVNQERGGDNRAPA